MHVIGLIGGVASGKSWVAGELAALGARVLDADHIGHEVLREKEVQDAIHKCWGRAVFTPAGEIDRAAVAKRVFAPPPDGPAELAFLEQLTHPRIRQRLQTELTSARESGVAAAVLDAALLMRGGWAEFCNSILYIDAPREMRLARALQRGWSETDFNARESSQEPLETKRKIATAIIDNSHSPERTREQLRQFWRTAVSPTVSH